MRAISPGDRAILPDLHAKLSAKKAVRVKTEQAIEGFQDSHSQKDLNGFAETLAVGDQDAQEEIRKYDQHLLRRPFDRLVAVHRHESRAYKIHADVDHQQIVSPYPEWLVFNSLPPERHGQAHETDGDVLRPGFKAGNLNEKARHRSCSD